MRAFGIFLMFNNKIVVSLNKIGMHQTKCFNKQCQFWQIFYAQNIILKYITKIQVHNIILNSQLNPSAELHTYMYFLYINYVLYVNYGWRQT